jgi:hypothetical protein
MDTWVTTLEELKKIRFSKFDKIFCKETQREYYIEPNGGSLTPDDLDIIQAAQGGTWRLVAQSASGGGGGEVNTGANVGAGAGVFRDKTGVQLNFRSLTAGIGVTLTPSADEIQIAAAGGGSAFPWPFKLVSADTTLTLADQGIIYQVNGIITLPAAAPDGTVFRIYGSTSDVRINSNGNLIAGIGIGTDLKPGLPMLQLVAFNVPAWLDTPQLIWILENIPTIDSWNSTRVYRISDIVHDDNYSYYMSRAHANTQPLTDTTKWLPLSPRRVTGTIAFSDLAFTATGAPSGLSSGTYSISECGDSLLLIIKLQLTGASTNVTAVRIMSTKATEIRTAFTTMYGGTSPEEDIFGYGYVTVSYTFSLAQRADVVYSPTTLGYIEARFAPVDGLTDVNMRVLMRK